MTVGKLKEKLKNVPDDLNIELEVIYKNLKSPDRNGYYCADCDSFFSAYGANNKLVKFGIRGVCKQITG